MVTHTKANCVVCNNEVEAERSFWEYDEDGKTKIYFCSEHNAEPYAERGVLERNSVERQAERLGAERGLVFDYSDILLVYDQDVTEADREFADQRFGMAVVKLSEAKNRAYIGIILAALPHLEEKLENEPNVADDTIRSVEALRSEVSAMVRENGNRISHSDVQIFMRRLFGLAAAVQKAPAVAGTVSRIEALRAQIAVSGRSVRGRRGSSRTQPPAKIPEPKFVPGKCSQCNAQNAADDKFCSKCGDKLPEPPTAEPEPEPFVPGKCTKCNAENAADARFCSNCGAELPKAPAATPEPEVPIPTKRRTPSRNRSRAGANQPPAESAVSPTTNEPPPSASAEGEKGSTSVVADAGQVEAGMGEPLITPPTALQQRIDKLTNQINDNADPESKYLLAQELRRAELGNAVAARVISEYEAAQVAAAKTEPSISDLETRLIEASESDDWSQVQEVAQTLKGLNYADADYWLSEADIKLKKQGA